jgi:hypothetical protein
MEPKFLQWAGEVSSSFQTPVSGKNKKPTIKKTQNEQMSKKTHLSYIN